MTKYLHVFETESEFQEKYNDFKKYYEPWISVTIENKNQLNYNNTEIYHQQPLTFRIKSNGNIMWRTIESSYSTTISYSKDYGVTWTNISSTMAGTSIPVVNGDVIIFSGNNQSYENNYFASSCQFEVEGNIMSLVNNSTSLSTVSVFAGLFKSNTGLTSAKNLVLPATTLVNSCYEEMFYGCSGLVTAPELPATTLAESCYRGMFYGCTSLTTAPELPATTLAESCYRGMFYGCTSLTTAPELPAINLTTYCYCEMFRNCSSLNYIKCLATNISAYYCTNYWVNNVSAIGTFVKTATMSGWTVIDA